MWRAAKTALTAYNSCRNRHCPKCQSAAAAEWLSSRSNFLVHVKVLARLFRGKFLAMLIDAHSSGRLKFFNTHIGLADKRTFKRFLAPLRRIEWVIYCKEPFAGPQQVLRYFSRYTHRVAISNRRLIAADDGGVSFRWKDYRIEGPGRWKTMTITLHEFIRRFLMHVLPKGFHRIRHYGLLTAWKGARGPKSSPVEGKHHLFGFLTTANAQVGAIHPKAMPMILRTEQEIET
jgi:Putative transposase/Transposase zinc-binding domain